MRALGAALIGAVLLLWGCVSIRGPLDGWPLDDMKAASVRLATDGGHGSGTLISPDYILTAWHVAQNADGMKAYLSDGSVVGVSVVWYNADRDVAIVKLAHSTALHFSKMACRVPQWGEEVAAVGNALEVHNNVAVGVIASTDAMAYDTSDPSQSYMIPVDATFNRGMSGGAVYSSDGKILGIVDATLQAPGMKGAIVPAVMGLMIPTSAFCQMAQEAMK